MRSRVMVVPRTALFPEGSFQGFLPAGGIDYERRVLGAAGFRERARAEISEDCKQPIGYALLVRPRVKTVFAYRRSSRDRDYPERRLQGKWSWGLGGHIEESDSPEANPIRASMLREIFEEVGLKAVREPLILGYINDDSDPVGRVHFGLLYLAEAGETGTLSLSPELAEGGFYPLEELERIAADPDAEVEPWSRLSLPLLHKFRGG